MSCEQREAFTLARGIRRGIPRDESMSVYELTTAPGEETITGSLQTRCTAATLN